MISVIVRTNGVIDIYLSWYQFGVYRTFNDCIFTEIINPRRYVVMNKEKKIILELPSKITMIEHEYPH